MRGCVTKEVVNWVDKVCHFIEKWVDKRVGNLTGCVTVL